MQVIKKSNVLPPISGVSLRYGSSIPSVLQIILAKVTVFILRYSATVWKYLEVNKTVEEVLKYIHDKLKLIFAIKKMKSVAYRSQERHSGQVGFCNWLSDGGTTR